MIDRIPEIFFDSPHAITEINITSAYDISPLGGGRWDSEGLLSYVYRLAMAHKVRPLDLIRFLCSRSTTGRSLIGYFCTRRSLQNDLGVFLGGCSALRLCALLCDATGYFPYVNHTLVPLASVVSAWELTRKTRMFCPSCSTNRTLQSQRETLGSTIKCVKACPIHGVMLLPVGCGNPEKREPFRIAPLLPGVCPDCGSIAHKCRSAIPKSAGTADIWAARQIGALVASFGSDTELSNDRMVDAIGELSKERFGGKLAWLAHAAGVSKGTLHSWMHKKSKPNLPHLLALCCASEVSLSELARGKLCYSPSPQKSSWTTIRRNRSHVHRRQEFARALRIELRKYPCKSLGMVSRNLRVEEKTIRIMFPGLSQRIVKKAALHRLMEKRRRRLVAKRVVLKAARKLRARGDSLSRRNFEKLLGTAVTVGDSLLGAEVKALKTRLGED